jgi:hypothetical protein
MEDIYSLAKYFPLSTSDEALSKYLTHHLENINKCVENELYSSAYSHLHLLYMAFVYIQLLRIAKENEEQFNYCWIGFPGEEKDYLKEPSSPFSFSRVKEKTVFRFFRLVGFDDSCIADISQLVTKRNGRLHASGSIYCEALDDFRIEYEIYIKKIEMIISKQREFLHSIYDALVITYDADYEITADDIETNFADQYYFSEYEMKNLAQGKTDIISKYIVENFV